ncbi:MAG: AI-2E family transporter [Hyphomicrobiales bacterium]|nr:MAG: AI-2E family transporter [Hyphomicrobiales bacterium]
MTLRNQVLVWGGFFVVAILLLWVFRSILLPFVIGMALAYLLNPLVNLLQRIKIPRSLASAIVLVLVLAVITGLVLMLVPLVSSQVAGLVLRLPAYIGDLQHLVQDFAPQLNEWLGPQRAAQLEASLADMIGTGIELAGSIAAQVAQSGFGVLNTLVVLFITPVVAFYLLLDWDGMVKRVDSLLPRQHRPEIRGVLAQIDRAMAGWLRGQGSVIVVLSIYYCTALWLVGLDFGIAIGLIGGILSFVPYVGFLIGFALSLTIALVQFWPDMWVRLLIVIGIYVVGQFLEGNILVPNLVGQSININPVWLMFALFAFGLLFGFVGLLLAVPLTAIAGVLIRYALVKYQESSLYLGEAVPEAPHVPDVQVTVVTEAPVKSARVTTPEAAAKPAAARPRRSPKTKPAE